MPFAAFFVAFLLLLCIPDGSRKLAVCLLLGALAGLCAVHTTRARLERARANYAGRTVLLTAEVERADSNYFSDTVDATLWVESVNGSPAGFRIACAELPACAAGQRVQGWFTLQQPDMEEQTAQYADGIALQAEPLAEKPQLTVLGESGSFRARTHRLQQKLSESLRRAMHRDTGGVLAAMTVGDRSGLSAQLRSAYRGAGLSHVLVVSGMHVSILCGDILSVLLPYRWEQSYHRRRRRAVGKSLLALVLMGVTGFTPSVRRAAVAVWVSALGVWVWGPPDALTSLAAAGILMTAANSYAVWDIGFELSFAAVVGTVAGNACIRRMRDAHDRRFWVKAGENLQKPVRRPWYSKLPKGVQGLAESACIAACASAATFPVLVLRGMSTTVWAVASGVAVLWLVGPMLSFGLGAALLGLAAEGLPLFEIIRRPVAFCAEGLAWLMNEWAFRVSVLPGASLWFDGTYAALVCLALILLCVMAMRRHIRLRVALPTVILLAALAIGLETALSWNVVNIELVGTRAAPAVVITQREKAIVLFRGSSITQRAVENQLEKRGVRTVELLVDLRVQPEEPCRIEAQKRINAAALAENTTRCASCGEVDLELFRTRQGCILRMRVGGQRFITLSGTVRPAKPIRAEWLLASMARPDNIRYTDCLTLSSKYRWMEGDAEPVSRLRLRLEGGTLFKAGRV